MLVGYRANNAIYHENCAQISLLTSTLIDGVPTWVDDDGKEITPIYSTIRWLRHAPTDAEVVDHDAIHAQRCPTCGGLICDCIQCDECGELRPDDTSYWVYSGGDEIRVCENCRNDSYSECEDCSGLYANDELLYAESNDCSYCNSCFNDRFTTCYDCDVEIQYNEGSRFRIDGSTEYLCTNCYDSRVDDEPSGSDRDTYPSSSGSGGGICDCEECEDEIKLDSPICLTYRRKLQFA